jgi:hypothetical protein
MILIWEEFKLSGSDFTFILGTRFMKNVDLSSPHIASPRLALPHLTLLHLASPHLASLYHPSPHLYLA